MFSNFIDIWNFHQSFLVSLSTYLLPTPADKTGSGLSDAPLSPILLSHFPYLSLYTPFITAFPTTIANLTSLTNPARANERNELYSPAFADFVREREKDERCGKLKLRDWLLTIVQRCPRYLLLLKDLMDCTSQEDEEHGQLLAVHTLVSKSEYGVLTCQF